MDGKTIMNGEESAGVAQKQAQSFSPAPLSIKISVVPPTFQMRVYFSSYHLWAAKHFMQLAANIEQAHTGGPVFDIEHRAYVTNSIFSSVAFIEAGINELFQDVLDGHMSYISSLPSAMVSSMATSLADEHRRPSALEKYQKSLIFAGKLPFKKGGLPYQDVYLLTLIRNSLTHYVPKTLGGSAIHELEDQLRDKGKFPTNLLMEGSGNPFFPDHCLGHGCAEWGVNASKSFADQFFTEIGVIPNYQRTDFDKQRSRS